MSLQLIQSINLLPLTLNELKQRIEEELEKNPALEAVGDKTLVSYDELDAMSGHRIRSSGSSFDDEDTQRRFLEGVISRGESLHEHLLWQLRLQPLPPASLEIGELLINNLDADGFHLEPPSMLFPLTDGVACVEAELIEELLETIRRLEPQGCAVSDWRESLLVQMRLQHFDEEATHLVTDGWELLEKKKYKELASRLKVSEDEIQALLEDLSSLTPFPGRAYSLQPPGYVVPDAAIGFKNGQLQLVFNEEEIPVLRIDDGFQSGLGGGLVDKDARSFVKQKVSEAERFIQNIRYRRSTLFQVCRSIMEFQVEFFRRGPKYLKPLTLRDVAEQIEKNESTVSRITTGKYVQTEWGLYELKHFFSNAISSSEFSKEGVKEIIREILSAHEAGTRAGAGTKKLSDQKISDLLSQRGIEIARRTVTKYRLELSKEYA
ncbi:MAG: RNA polymerase factor sigma-54 [Spirochaetales bacterium]